MSLMTDFVDKLPIEKGDVVLFSSDYVNFALYFIRHNENIDINLFFDLVLEKIGENGTILFPTYNWGFCKGETFDYKNTPSKTGQFSQMALKHPAFKRTKHPIYSFAVAGKDRDYLYSLNNTDSFGDDSPFAYLHKKDGKNIILDVSMQDSFTLCHFVEQMVSVPYRFLKEFRANYIDEMNNETERSYTMYVRDFDLNATNNFAPMEKYLLENEIVYKTEIGYSSILCVPIIPVCEEIKKDILFNKAKKIATYTGQYD